MSEIIRYEDVADRILTIRNQQVLLSMDVAELYGVETREVNQAVKNNLRKFPEDYVILLGDDEKMELIKNFDKFKKLKHSPSAPTAFTEKGMYMLATILKSPKATETTIAIVETFAKIRELAKTMNKLPDEEDENKQKALLQRTGEILADVLGNDELGVTDTETTLELNLALVKVKHTVKHNKR